MKNILAIIIMVSCFAMLASAQTKQATAKEPVKKAQSVPVVTATKDSLAAAPSKTADVKGKKAPRHSKKHKKTEPKQ